MSHNNSDSYVPIVEDGRAGDPDRQQPAFRPPPAKSGSVFRISLAVLFVGLACGVTYVVTRNHFRTSSTSYDRAAKYEVPSAYTATLDFHIPYINFTEPLTVHVDNDKASMHLSYYSGADVYVYTPNTSYTIVPVFDKMTCLQSGGSAPVNVFPDMQYFKLQSGVERLETRAFPDGVDCDIWKFEFNNQTTGNNGSWHATLPNADGYVGDYFFYRSKEDGSPVAFRARYGHNVVLGGSHYDKYQLDYVQVAELPSVDDMVFRPPSGMQCYDHDLPTGPTRMDTHHGAMTRSNAAHDLEMIFPRGEPRRAGLYGAWQQRFGKAPAGDAAERKLRAGIFHNNVRLINSHNRANKGFTLNLNHMADWTESERHSLLGYANSGANTSCGTYNITDQTVPDHVDWRGKSLGGPQQDPGQVNPPTDQGSCGSCWSFGAASAAEAAHYRKHRKLIKLSQQSMMDCTWATGNRACGGGEDFLGYEWLMQHNDGQWASDESYGGYLNQDGFCHFARDVNKTENPWTGKPVEAGTTLESCTMVTKNTSTNAERVVDLRNALAHVGVLSVAIDASQPIFYFYESGYYYSEACSSTELDHQVTAVGYVKHNDGQFYTIVRNSWSTHWGMNGFVYMSQKDNNCGVGTMPTFVMVQ
jgi:hypothetical protein